jgi:hypothetical protein
MAVTSVLKLSFRLARIIPDVTLNELDLAFRSPIVSAAETAGCSKVGEVINGSFGSTCPEKGHLIMPAGSSGSITGRSL